MIARQEIRQKARARAAQHRNLGIDDLTELAHLGDFDGVYLLLQALDDFATPQAAQANPQYADYDDLLQEHCQARTKSKKRQNPALLMNERLRLNPQLLTD